MPNLPEDFEDFVRRTLSPHVDLHAGMSADQMIHTAKEKMLDIKDALYTIYQVVEQTEGRT
jgi:hypothetical protein